MKAQTFMSVFNRPRRKMGSNASKASERSKEGGLKYVFIPSAKSHI